MFPNIPAAAEPLVQAIAVAFTKPTLRRFVVLMCGLIVTLGRRTVSHALVPVAALREREHWSDYHRLYSAARFSMWKLAAALVRQAVALLPPQTPITRVADDTVDAKAGDRVWAKAAHRDAVRSTRGRNRVVFGHPWRVLCVLVELPGLARPWALPVLCGLCLSSRLARQVGRRPKTASQLTRQMLIVLMRWLPDRKFLLLGDAKVLTHQTACFASRHADRVTVVGRLRGDANLYAPPTHPRRRSRTGQPVKKGRKRPTPATRVEQLACGEQEVAWYGARRRRVRYAGETGVLWYNKHSGQVVPIRWVCVRGDAKQGRADAYFYSSDPAMPATRIIEAYAARWNIEVTFEEARALLGLGSTRHWCRRSVLRVTPLLLGLFSAVALIWARLPEARRCCVSQTPCYAKSAPTFADALGAVRRELWETTLLAPHPADRCLDRLPPHVRQTLLWHLAAAA